MVSRLSVGIYDRQYLTAKDQDSLLRNIKVRALAGFAILNF